MATQPQDLLVSSAQATKDGLDNIKYRRNNRFAAVPIGNDTLDEIFLPILPGEMMNIIARPGHGKTGFMLWWARHRARLLAENNINKAVVYVSCEQTIDELDNIAGAAETGIALNDIARGNISDDDLRKLEKSAMERGSSPNFFWIGKSKSNRRKRPKISPESIVETLFYLEQKTGIKPDVCFIDYLQLLKPSQPTKYGQKNQLMTDILEECKDGALDTDCGWVVGCQARREVDMQQLPIPGLDSGQWTSAIEQFSDKVVSLTRPCKYKKENEYFGQTQVKGKSQMLFSLLKQKLGEDNISRWMYFDPAYNKLHDLEMNYAVRD